MRQFEISCSRCGKKKRVRHDNFIRVSYNWKSGGGTLICPDCARHCNVIVSRDKTIENMVLSMFEATEPWEGD